MMFRGRGRDGARLGIATLAVAAAGSALAAAPVQATVSVSSPTVTEGSTGATTATFTITDEDLFCGGSAAAETADGTAKRGSDYTTVAGATVSFSVLKCTATVSVPVTPDKLDEDNETFLLRVVEGGTTVTGTATIADDDLPPKVSVTAGTAPEGTGAPGQVTLPVALSAVSGRTVTVPYTVQPGTAATPEDFDASPGSVTIPAGSAGATIVVPVGGDDVDEPDETFTVTLGTPANATLQTAQATGTIANDDTPAATVAGVALAEGTGQAPTPFPFTITLSNPSTRSLSVRFATADVQARAGGDYTAVSEVVTFAPGERSRTVVVPVAADAEDEPDEAFSGALSEPQGLTLPGSPALGAILDDDGAPSPSRPGTGSTGTGSGGGGTGSGSAGGGPGTTSGGSPTSGASTGPDRTAPRALLRSLRVRRPRSLQVRITCPATETRCEGRVTVFSVVVRTAKLRMLRREVRLAGGSYRLAGGASRTVTMRTTSTGLRLLRAAKRFRARAYGVTRDVAGNVGTTTVTATLRR